MKAKRCGLRRTRFGIIRDAPGQVSTERPLQATGQPEAGVAAGRPRVVLVSPLPPPLSGLTVWTDEFLRAATVGLDVAVVDISPGGSQVNTRSRIRLRRVQQMFTSMRELRRSLPGNDIAHLCTSWFFSLIRDGIFARLARRAGVVPVLHVHASTDVAASVAGLSSLERLALKRLLRPFGAIVVLTADLRDLLTAALPHQRVVVVPNGVDTTRFSPAPSRETLPGVPVSVLFVGRLSVDKGICELAEAVIANPSVRLTTIGDRPASDDPRKESAVQAALDALDASGRHTHFANVGRDAIADHYRHADMFVLPSHREGMPVALLEAMASGLPCVITPVGAMTDIVTAAPEAFTMVVSVGDVSGLTAALHTLATDAALRLQLGSAARRIAVSRFSSAASMLEMLSLYSDLTAESRRGRRNA